MRRLAGGVLLALCAAAVARAAGTAPVQQPFAAAATLIQSRTLANGLQVVVWPDHHIPDIVINNWVHVGSRNEGTGTTGLAHFFEHMMFKGTTAHPDGSFDRLLEDAGASNNAYTSTDVTVFQDWLPRAALPLVLQLEADRLENLAFVPEVVESERKVVYSERRLRVEDSNPAMLSEQMEATAFIAHPYRIPTIGWPSDIQSWTLADLQDFYRRSYAPNNCTLVITGDIDPEAAFALVEKDFGAIPRRDPPPPVKTQEPEQFGERRFTLERPGQNPLLEIAWHGISAVDPRAAALDVLQVILVGGDAARLRRSLVDEQRLAVDVGGGWAEGFDPSLFEIEATLPEGASPAALEMALDAQIARLLKEGITDAELARAKNLVATSFWEGVSTIDGKARMLGEYTVIHGDYHRLFDAPAAYERVTREDVLAVAREVFVKAHRTVGVLQPKAAADEP